MPVFHLQLTSLQEFLIRKKTNESHFLRVIIILRITVTYYCPTIVIILIMIQLMQEG